MVDSFTVLEGGLPMPFKETCRMEERVGMLSDFDSGAFSVSALCRRYGISRDTFYLWHDRRAGGHADWFMDRSHAVHECPHRTTAELEARIIATRKRFRHFGPKKIRAWLMEHDPHIVWPAASTMGDILKRAGLVTARSRQRRQIEQGRVVCDASEANEEWSVDFKGWFLTGNGTRCDPLTIADSHTRYQLDTRISDQKISSVKRVFTRLFYQYGLPQSLRCDNGSPFGSHGAGGLTRLSAWWLRLGVDVRFITPASPQENGRHERFHRTLNEHTACPPAQTLKAQQIAFDRFRHHYNEERPHEALGQIPPARLWSPSMRTMPTQLPEPEYDPYYEVRRVRSNGQIKWGGTKLYVSDALIGQRVALKEIRDGIHIVRFCNVDVGIINRAGKFARFAPVRHKLRKAKTVEDQPGPKCR